MHLVWWTSKGKAAYHRKTFYLLFSAILIQILLLYLVTNVNIVTELALVSLLTSAGLEVCTQDRLQINPKGHLLGFHRLE